MSTTFAPSFDGDARSGRRVILSNNEQESYSALREMRREPYGNVTFAPAQQVPMEYYEQPYQSEMDYPVAEMDMADDAICGCLPPLAVGYLVCLFTLLEGIVLLLHVTKVVEPSRGLFPGLYDGHNPFGTSEKVILWVVSVTDLAAVLVGVAGLYLSVHLAPDRVRRAMTRGSAGNLPTMLIGLLLLWRILVTFGTAPFVGVMLAFSTPDTDRTPYIVWAMLFIFVNIVLVYGLAQVFRAAAMESELVGERTQIKNNEERRNFLHGAYRNQLEFVDEEPRLFGCLPLELTLGLWSLTLTVACVVAFVELCAAGITVGGWAYFISVPDVRMIRALEFVTYFLGALFALTALVGIIGHHSGRVQEADSLASFGTAEYTEELEQAIKAKKRGTVAILVFFIGSLFRISCFIPITGMALVAKDVCGIYVHGLSTLSLSSESYGTRIHCGGNDFGMLFFVTAMAVLDFYILWGVFKLWHAYRSASFAVKEGMPSASYGSAAYPQKAIQ